MIRFVFIIQLVLLFFTNRFHAQDGSPFDLKSSNTFGTYAIEIAENKILPEKVKVKYRANGWTYVLADRSALYELMNQGIISRIYREPQTGIMALNDSTRSTHYVNDVHNGLGLDFSFTGKGVIMGYIDNGLDVNHGDFLDTLGNSRVLRFWNQGQSVNFRTPSKYGYGRVYTNIDLDNNINPGQINQSSHGTTVTGAGSGNGLANGRNKGVAPDCNIIVVRTVTSLPSWTLTVAEGVDFIFSVADSLGMPAVVNISYGTYLGSHDGKDPAGLYIDSLLNDKEGRIVVCAAGNSGNWDPYHVQQELSADTNFVWMIPNPALAYGSPGSYFDLWADTVDIQNMHFAFGADAPGPVYRGNTTYNQVDFSNQTVQYDTIFGINNDVLAEVIFQGQVVGQNYNLQAIVFTDSLSYNFRFLATGQGKIDLWSSTNIGGSKFNAIIPDTLIYPEFVHYMMPDTLQSVVSSWACSDQVITVGNIQNRLDYVDFQGNVYPIGGGTIPSGILSATSSKGPNRQGSVKPELVATGDMSLSARVTSFVYQPVNMLDQGGMHVRNGGTSMASPVVAGIAALYLEKCPISTWEDFKNDVIQATFIDSFTGNQLPNYAYGYGKAHALNTLLQTEFDAEIVGSGVFCPSETLLEVFGENIDQMIWNTTDTIDVLSIDQTGSYYGTAVNEKGCKNFTDTLLVIVDADAPSATAPEDTWVSCVASIPLPDPNLVINLFDNCEIADVVHLDDSLHVENCVEFVERTYRVSDASGNYTDVIQLISILQGTEPSVVGFDETIQLFYACEGVFVHPDYCNENLLSIDGNGNSLDLESAEVVINHQYLDPLPLHVETVNSGNSGYYQTDDGLNTFRISKKLYTLDIDGVFPLNGGVIVRLYYDDDDINAIENDVPDFGMIENSGWFKSSHHDLGAIVNDMSASIPLLSSATIVTPLNNGQIDGVSYVEFMVDSFSTFGYFASTQLTPLPVELEFFSTSCEDDELLISWTTASEYRSSHFLLQSSKDGFFWEDINTISAHGTTNQIKNYQVTLSRPHSLLYFRLLQVDLDGGSQVFGPVSASCEIHNSHWYVSPNPACENVQVVIESLENDLFASLHLCDLNGKLIENKSLALSQGQNLFNLEIGYFSPGVYFLSVKGLEHIFSTIKLVVSNH